MFNSKILIGTPIKNNEKYIENLINLIDKIDYPKNLISLCFIENDSEDDTWSVLNKVINDRLKVEEYNKITLKKLDLGFKLKHENRYDTNYTIQRIKSIVITRNYIINNYLKDAEYLWWLDADVVDFDKNIVKDFLNINKDVVMPIYYTNNWLHDCASHIIVNNKIIRLGEISNLYPTLNSIKLIKCECAAFIKRKVFEIGLRYFVKEENYIDLCGNVFPCKMEGVSFSEKALEFGFEIYGALKIKIKHID
jgi:hypothetical protein